MRPPPKNEAAPPKRVVPFLKPRHGLVELREPGAGAQRGGGRVLQEFHGETPHPLGPVLGRRAVLRRPCLLQVLLEASRKGSREGGRGGSAVVSEKRWPRLHVPEGASRKGRRGRGRGGWAIVGKTRRPRFDFPQIHTAGFGGNVLNIWCKSCEKMAISASTASTTAAPHNLPPVRFLPQPHRPGS